MEQTCSVKFHSVLPLRNLYDVHIGTICKIIQIMCSFFKIRDLLPISMFVFTCYSLFSSLLQYGRLNILLFVLTGCVSHVCILKYKEI